MTKVIVAYRISNTTDEITYAGAVKNIVGGEEYNTISFHLGAVDDAIPISGFLRPRLSLRRVNRYAAYFPHQFLPGEDSSLLIFTKGIPPNPVDPVVSFSLMSRPEAARLEAYLRPRSTAGPN